MDEIIKEVGRAPLGKLLVASAKKIRLNPQRVCSPWHLLNWRCKLTLLSA